MSSARRSLTKLCLALLATCAANGAGVDGAALYAKNCAACHEAGAARIPNRAALHAMPPDSVLRALVSGAMRFQGWLLSAEERDAVARFLTGKAPGAGAAAQTGQCPGTAPALEATAASWNGWGLDPDNSRRQTAAAAGLTAADVPKLKLKWAFGFPGDFVAYAQPTVFGGRVFMGSQSGTVYALDARSGCTYWSFAGLAGVRTAIPVGPREGGGYALYFGDLQANVYSLDAATGKLLWKASADENPAARITGSPKLYGGRLFVPVSSGEEWMSADSRYECCRSRGSVAAFDAATGKRIWKTYTIAEPAQPTHKSKAGTQLWGPSGASVWSSPALDLKRNALYVGTGDNYSAPPVRTSDAILAMDMDTGKLLWSRQMTEHDMWTVNCLQIDQSTCPDPPGPDYDFGASPILRTLANGKRALIAAQKSGVVHALDPDQQGEVLWQAKIGKGGVLGGIQWGAAADERTVYVPLSDLTVQITDPAKLQAAGGYQPAPDQGGGLFALRLSDGKPVWTAAPAKACEHKPGCSPAQSAAATLIPGVVFSGAVDGHLRAYSSEDGAVLWDYDTAHEFKTVNGVAAHGGSIDGPGAVVAGGMVYTNSGYGLFNAMPGNVLLAFGVEPAFSGRAASKSSK